jgi:undecaprenyl-diphosphatase
MTVIQAVILGFVQGVTEFLPISSSGHLVLLQRLWNIQGDSLLFITMLHLGTLAAVLWAFHKEVRWLIRNPLSRRALLILVALIPTALVGAFFEEAFEHLFDSGITVGFEFVITGVVLWWMDGVGASEKSDDDITVRDALWIGALQGAAILPALSRSGLTIAGGLWRKIDKGAAGRFSFLLSIPAILGATIFQLEDLVEDPQMLNSVHWLPVVCGTVVAGISGYAAVKGTMWLLRTSKMRIFAVYVWLLAAFILSDQLFFHKWFPPLVS